MTEAADGTAANLERSAVSSAEQIRRDATQASLRVAENIGAIEHELSVVLRAVSAEADGLRAKLDRARLLSSGPEITEVRLSLDAEATDMGPEPPALASPAEESEPSGHVETSEAPDEPAGAPDDLINLPEEGEDLRRRVAESSDLELAELFSLARETADASSEQEEVARWNAAAQAAVEEAVARPDFGYEPEGPASGSWAKKQRSKSLDPRLEPLMEARTSAVGSASDSAGSDDDQQ